MGAPRISAGYVVCAGPMWVVLMSGSIGPFMAIARVLRGDCKEFWRVLRISLWVTAFVFL